MSSGWHERLWPREGWGVFLLTLALVTIVGAAVADAGWANGLEVITAVSLCAFAIGFLVARSRLPIMLAHVFSLIIGLAWSFRVTTSLFPETYSWTERWAWMWYRIYHFGQKLVSSGTSDDSLVFILQMGLLVWIITYLTVWSVFRSHRVWHAIILSGLLFLGTFYYAPRDLTGYFIFFLLVALLLVIRFNLYLQEQVWRRRQVQYNAGEITFDFWRAGLALSLLVVALAWLAPSIPFDTRSRALDALRGPWYDVEERWSRLFTTLNYRASPGVDFSGLRLGLGGPRELSDTPVMEIRPSHNVRYWREAAFDDYTGHGWVNSDDTIVQIGADYTPIPFVSYQSRLPVSHTVTALIPNTAVLALAGEPVWVSLPARARLSYVREGLAQGISYARSRLPFQSGDTYTASELYSVAAAEQLRTAGDAYPEWVQARYLQLPDELPDRVRALAHTVTAASTSAYDRATAVESFLRREITYNERIEAPPSERDSVDYLLFDSRQGYCDYYASAMVVMLRAVGVPARLAAGYARGEYRYEKNALVVRQTDAHAWPEAFFPDYGWIEFEPTSAQPMIERLSGTDAVESSLNEPASAAEDAPESAGRAGNLDRLEGGPAGDTAGWTSALSGPMGWLSGLALLAALAVGVLWLKARRDEAGLSRVEAAYFHMVRLASWAGVDCHAWQTPYEHAAALAAAAPGVGAPARRVADWVTRERYAGHSLAAEERAELAATWRALRPHLVAAALRRQLQQLVGRSPALGQQGMDHLTAKDKRGRRALPTGL